MAKKPAATKSLRPPEYPSPIMLEGGLGMGEEVVGAVKAPAPYPRAVDPVTKIHHRRSILTCTACELRAGCRAPVPWDGQAPNLAMVIGEAPGGTEDRLGRPFVGVSGQLLRNTIRQLGVDPEQLTYANAACCLPSYKPPTPKTEHLDACAPNLARQLKIVSPAHVLLVGGVALSRFRADLKVSSCHGRPFVIPSPCAPAASGAGLWCFPLIHPAAILRDQSQRGQWLDDLALWLAIVTADGWPARYLPITCTLCRKEVHRYDPDGVAWCESHWPKGYAGWQASERKRKWMFRAELEIQAGMAGVNVPERQRPKPEGA